TCRTGGRGDTEVPRRPDRDSGQRYALFVGQCEHLYLAGRSYFCCRERPCGRCQRGLRRARTREWHSLWATRSVVGNAHRSSKRSNLQRSEGNFDLAIRSRSQRAAAGLTAGYESKITTGRDAADIQRRVPGIGEGNALSSAGSSYDLLSECQRGRRESNGWTACLSDGELYGRGCREGTRGAGNGHRRRSRSGAAADREGQGAG